MTEPRRSRLAFFSVAALLLLFFCLAFLRATSSTGSLGEHGDDDLLPPPSSPKSWPDQFHALLYMNLTDSGKLLVTDLWYDWPRGRNMNRMQQQLSDVLYDVEWDNGTSFYYTLPTDGEPSCLVRRFPVGIPRRDWMEGSTYLGIGYTDGIKCYMWTKLDFIWYYEDVDTRRPVRWDFFDGIETHVMTFEVGGVLEDSKWQAPDYCFNVGGDSNIVGRSPAETSHAELEYPFTEHSLMNVLRTI